MVFYFGCGQSEKGRFSEEQMSSIPLAKRSSLPEATGGLVLSVSDQTITANEIIKPMQDKFEQVASGRSYAQFRRLVRPSISKAVSNKVADILLYEKARETAPENIEEAVDKAVDMEVNRFVAQYHGNYADAQKAIEDMGYDWSSFRDYQRKFLMTQSYVAKTMDEEMPVTHQELLDYYDKVKDQRFVWDSTLKFSLIDIVPEQLEVASNETVDKQAAAMQVAKDLVHRIRSGQDFADIARQYSHGHRAIMGGQWREVTKGSLASPYDVIEKKAENMHQGQVSDPIKADGHIFIVKLHEKRKGGVEKFEKVQPQLEAELKFQRKREKWEKMVTDLIDQANIADLEGFIEYCIRQAYSSYN
jgi:parvulin-like peptidyl-prolyl isomerase